MSWKKKDVVVNSTEIKPGFTLHELRASTSARVSRWVVVTNDTGWQLGEVKRPNYGSRKMEVISPGPWRERFELRMQAPATAESLLVDAMRDFIVKYA